MSSQDGSKVRGFQGLVDMVVHHFESMFKEHVGANVEEILKAVSFFPRMVNNELCEKLYILVTKEELLVVLSTFRKEKILGPDHWWFGVRFRSFFSR
jgi:hypothetical protein